MLELAPLKLAVVDCHGRPDALEGLAVMNTLKLRIAPDEVLLLAPPPQAEAIVVAARSEIGDGALVVDQTDAYTAWMIRGQDAFELFARLSDIPLSRDRPGMQQGLVAKVPTKILVNNNQLQLIVPSNLGHHICERLLSAGADLEVRLLSEVEFRPAAAVETVA